MPVKQQTNLLLVNLVFSQFAGTSLWFAGNAIVDQITPADNGANMTSYVQLGFIAGTFLFSLLTIADRFQAKYVFFYSSVLAATANFCIIPFHKTGFAISVLRFTTGFFLAGIYPVGMKIVADVFPQKLGKALGLLVGALVLGTSFPHLVRSGAGDIHWQTVILTTSVLAITGGATVLFFIPSKEKATSVSKPDFSTALAVFRNKPFLSAAFGYFGHMWELYALWSILPLLFTTYHSLNSLETNVFWWSFLVIAVGGLGCAFGGLFSQKWGSEKVAFTALLLSGTCCLAAPIFFKLQPFFFYPFVLIWGITVTADSPQFSAMVAKATEDKNKGTALSVVTCIGFAITIVSIQLLKDLFQTEKENALWLLAPGPLLGLLALNKMK